MKVGFLNDKGEPGQFNALAALKPLFEKNGIEFASSDADVDLILARPEALAADYGKPYLTAGRPIIILERADSSALDATTRTVIHHKSVIAVFKNRVLRQNYLHNYPTANEGRFHGKRINDYALIEKNERLPSLDRESLTKIRMVIWDIESSFAHPRYENEGKIWNTYEAFDLAAQKRDIDVLYLGSAGVYSKIINWHRQKFIDGMRELNGLRVVTEGRYDYATYADLMRRTKIAVSPWGWGEWCWRDVEAVYFGCALVKPDTDFVLTYPDLFRDNNYYRCSPDAGDLAAAVDCALVNWQQDIGARFELRRKMLGQMNVEQLMSKLTIAIHDAYALRLSGV